MRKLSPHSQNILALLNKSGKHMVAYDIMSRLRIKAPPTVYRALDTLIEKGLVHRIESLNAFIACHEHDDHHKHEARFAVCRSCGSVTEIHDHTLSDLIHALSKKLKFHIEREMLELLGLCDLCERKQLKKA